MMTTNKTALITGATGMVGRQVLNLLLESPEVGKVVSIGRRKTDMAHRKLHEIVHTDFLDLSAVKSDLADIDVCFHCLAVYQNQVSKQAYIEITCDYQKALTDSLAEVSPRATFVLFGASGADPSGKSWASFARVKGRAENLLNQTGFPKKYIFRPGYIHPTGTRKPPGRGYRFLLPVLTVLLNFYPRLGITDRDLAKAMVSIGIESKQESTVVSNRMIREITVSRRPSELEDPSDRA